MCAQVAESRRAFLHPTNNSDGESKMKTPFGRVLSLIFLAVSMLLCCIAQADPTGRPNIILILSDDFGYGDSGPYGGGEGRGMPTPSLDRLAQEGMTFYSNYAQPSCTPGRAAVQTGRIPNRNGMTTVAFQGPCGGRWVASYRYLICLRFL